MATFIPTAGCPRAPLGHSQHYLCQCDLATTPCIRAASSPAPPHAPQKPIPQLQTLVPFPMAQAFTLHVDRAPARGPWAILSLLLQAGWWAALS